MEPEDSRAGAEDLAAVLLGAPPETLLTLLDDPRLDETHVCLLLRRADLGSELVARVADRREWLDSRRVRCSLAAHPHAPRRVALRLVRELAPMDLLSVSLQPAAPPEVRRLADELLLVRVPGLPLGQKLTLARRASTRVAGTCLAESNERVAAAALENSRMTEGEVLRALGRPATNTAVLALIARHPRWSRRPALRDALIRHPRLPIRCIPVLLAGLPSGVLRELSALANLRPQVRSAIRERLESIRR